MSQIDPIPKRQLLSFKVRGPEIAQIFKELKTSGPLTHTQVIERFVPLSESRNDDMVRDGLDMLRALELIWRIQTDSDNGPSYKLNEDISSKTPFSLLVLKRLSSFNDDRCVFRLIHNLLIANNLLFVNRHDLMMRLEKAYPQKKYAWNLAKIRTWRVVSAYFGLVRSVKPSDGDILVSPKSRLLTQMMLAYATHEGISTNQKFEIPIRDWLDFVQTHYCQCLTEKLRVHQGLASALLSMEKGSLIVLKMLSDAGSERLLDRAVSHIEVASASNFERNSHARTLSFS